MNIPQIYSSDSFDSDSDESVDSYSSSASNSYESYVSSESDFDSYTHTGERDKGSSRNKKRYNKSPRSNSKRGKGVDPPTAVLQKPRPRLNERKKASGKNKDEKSKHIVLPQEKIVQNKQTDCPSEKIPSQRPAPKKGEVQTHVSPEKSKERKGKGKKIANPNKSKGQELTSTPVLPSKISKKDLSQLESTLSQLKELQKESKILNKQISHLSREIEPIVNNA